jgi:hypothetical protein
MQVFTRINDLCINTVALKSAVKIRFGRKFEGIKKVS